MKYKITNTVDSQGMPVEVWHTDQMGQNPELCAAYMRGMVYLLERGWTMAPLELANNAHRAIWLEHEGEVLGGVTYEYSPPNKQGWIVFIYVEEKWRGRHLYTILQRNLENEVIKLGGTSIASMAHKDNEARLKAGEREGMLPQYIRLYKDLTPVLDERKNMMTQKSGKTWDQLNKETWIYPNAYIKK